MSDAIISYAAFILADAGLDITSENLLTVTKAAGANVDNVWYNYNHEIGNWGWDNGEPNGLTTWKLKKESRITKWIYEYIPLWLSKNYWTQDTMQSIPMIVFLRNCTKNTLLTPKKYDKFNIIVLTYLLICQSQFLFLIFYYIKLQFTNKIYVYYLFFIEWISMILIFK